MGHHHNTLMHQQHTNGLPANPMNQQYMSLPASGVPTGQLVDLNGSGNNGHAVPKRHSMSEASSHSGRAGAAIPLTIKHLEEENKRKSYHVWNLFLSDEIA